MSLLNLRSIHGVTLVLAFVSGAAALAHQVLWVRMMVDVLGAGTGTFARVTGAFFLGLALGAWVAATRTPRRPWMGLCVLEGYVAIMAGVVLAACAFLPELLTRGIPAQVAWLLPFALILPPAFGMGMTLPWMIRASRAKSKRATWIYAANTAGAVAGIVGVLGWALPTWGLYGAALSAMATNLVVALTAGIISFTWPVTKALVEGSKQNASLRHGVLAFASGFLILGQETILQQQFAQVTINSLFSSGTVLAVVLLCLAAAAFAVPALVQNTQGVNFLLPLACALAAVTCALQPMAFTIVTGGLQALRYEVSMGLYLLEVGKLGLFAVAPAMLCAGLIFPLLIMAVRGDARIVGQLIAWNGLGGLLGAEITQLGIGPLFGLWMSMALLGCGYLLLVIRSGKKLLITATGVLVLGGMLGTPGLPQAGVKAPARVVDIQLGSEGVVGVIERSKDHWNILFNNTYTLGGSRAQFNQERQALLPLILHSEAKTAATLGIATGSTLAGAALDKRLEQIDAMELSPLAEWYARRYFGPYNREVFKDWRVRVLIGDARWLIAENPNSYDVVIGDLFLPWRTGEGRLFSKEHFGKVKESLREDGIYCQWLPLYQLTREQYDTILRTFLSAFPDTFLIRGDFYHDRPIIGLVGGRKLENLDWEKIAETCEILKTENLTKDALVRNANGIAMLLLGPAPQPPDGPLNTLANAWLEWDAGRNIIGLRQPWFANRAFAEYSQDIKAHLPSLIPNSLHPALQASFTLIHNRRNDPTKWLPSELAADEEADWSKWPGTPRPFAK